MFHFLINLTEPIPKTMMTTADVTDIMIKTGICTPGLPPFGGKGRIRCYLWNIEPVPKFIEPS